MLAQARTANYVDARHVAWLIALAATSREGHSRSSLVGSWVGFLADAVDRRWRDGRRVVKTDVRLDEHRRAEPHPQQFDASPQKATDDDTHHFAIDAQALPPALTVVAKETIIQKNKLTT